MIFTRLRRLHCKLPMKILVCFMIASLLMPCVTGLAYTSAFADEGAGYSSVSGESDSAGDGSVGGETTESTNTEATETTETTETDSEAVESVNEEEAIVDGEENIESAEGAEANENVDGDEITASVDGDGITEDADENNAETTENVDGDEITASVDGDSVTENVDGSEDTTSLDEGIVEEEELVEAEETIEAAKASVTVNINTDSLVDFGLTSGITDTMKVKVFEPNDLWFLIQDDEGYPVIGDVNGGQLVLSGLTAGEYYRFLVTGLPVDCVPEGSGWTYIELPWFLETLTGYYQDVMVAEDGQVLNMYLASDSMFQILLANTYKVTFVVDGYSESYSDVTVEEGDVVAEPINPPSQLWPTGMLSFLGWFEDGATNSFDFTQPITKNMQLKARFSANYLIKFKDRANGMVVDTILVSPGQIVPQTNVAVAPPAGFRLLYWVDETNANPSDPASAYVFGTERATANISLIPYFSNAYLVVFISQGTQVDSQIVSAGNLVEAPANPTRAGWTFAGWQLNNGQAYNFSDPVNRDLILYTSWTPNSSVKYQVALWMEVPNYASGDPDAVPAPPTSGGSISNYHFVGSVELYGTSGEMTNLSATTLPADITGLFNGTSSSPTDLLRYAVFQDVDNKIIQGNGSTVINLYASRKVYTYVFNLGDATGHSMNIATVNYTSGSATKFQMKVKYEINIYDRFPVQGVDFVDFSAGFSYWHRPSGMVDMTNIGSRRNVVDKGMLTENGQTQQFEFAANWSAVGNSYEYRYLVASYPGQQFAALNSIELNGATYVVMDEFSQGYQGNLSQKIINGLTMVNTDWQYTDPTGGVPVTFRWRPYSHSDQTGYTSVSGVIGPEYFRCFFYERTPYTLTFNGNVPPNAQGTVVVPASRVVRYGVPVGAQPEDPTLTGHTFLGWYRDSELREEFNFDMTMPNSDLTAYAKWQSSANTVTFHDGIYGKEIKKIGVETNGYINFDELDLWQKGDVVEDFGQFDGWYWFVSTIMVEYSPSIPVNGDYNLYAMWRTNGFTITYDTDGGQGTPPRDNDVYALGKYARIQPGPGLTKDNGVFAGWKAYDTNGNVLNNGRIFYPGNTMAVFGDIRLVAQYLDRASVYWMIYKANYSGGTDIEFGIPRGISFQLGYEDTFARAGYIVKYWTETAEDQGVMYATSSILPATKMAELAAKSSDGGTITLFAQWESYSAEVVITAASDKKAYDGTPLTKDDFTCTGISTDYTVEAEIVGTITNPGSVDNVVESYVITRKRDGADYTNYFTNVRTVNGKLEVTRAEITITAGSASKTYNGTPLTNPNYTIAGLPKDNFTGTAVVTGTITNVGTADNVVTSYAFTRDGETTALTTAEADALFAVTLVKGTLTIGAGAPTNDTNYPGRGITPTTNNNGGGSSGGDSGGSTTIPDTSVPYTDFPSITDWDVPDYPVEYYYEYEDDYAPLSEMPQTGADNSLLPWIIGLFASILMAFVLVLRIRKTI